MIWRIKSTRLLAIGIYKITNLINGKVYISQSKNIRKRWNNHKNSPFNKNNHCYNTELYRSIRKNGLDSFEFEIIEECEIDDLNKREKYWIEYYNSFFNGYNYTLGGDAGPIQNKESIIGIINDLKNTNLSNLEIAKKYNVTDETVSSINTGRTWHQNIDYPIRKPKVKKIKKCEICGNEIKRQSTMCVECYKNKQSENIPPKETLIDLISKYSFEEIGRQYGVTGKAVRKWCDSYGLKDHQKYDNNGVFCKTLNIKFDSFKEAAQYLIDNGYSNAKDVGGLAYGISKAKRNNRLMFGLIFV